MEAASDVPCKGHGPHVCCGNKKEHSLKTSVEKSNASSQRVSQHAQVCLKLLCSQNESTRTRVESSERGDVLVFCTLPSQACAHHVDTSTRVDCSALFKTYCEEPSHICPLTLPLRITWHCVDRVSKHGWWWSLVADDGQWERALSSLLSWCCPGHQQTWTDCKIS